MPACNIQFPIVTRVIPQLISNQIVSVQPMSTPVANTFYINPQIDGIDYLLYKKKLLIIRMNDFYKKQITKIYENYDMFGGNESFYIELELEGLLGDWNGLMKTIEVTKLNMI